MPKELERATVDLVRKVYGGREQPTPDWLQRPGAAEARHRWELVQALYAELTDMQLPDTMPRRERRTVDCVLQRRGSHRGSSSLTSPSTSIATVRSRFVATRARRESRSTR